MLIEQSAVVLEARPRSAILASRVFSAGPGCRESQVSERVLRSAREETTHNHGFIMIIIFSPVFVPNLGGEAAKNQEVGIANALERTSQSLGLFSTTMRVTRVEDAIGIDGGRLCTDSFANLSLGTRRAVSHRFLESVERVFFFFFFFLWALLWVFG